GAGALQGDRSALVAVHQPVSRHLGPERLPAGVPALRRMRHSAALRDRPPAVRVTLDDLRAFAIARSLFPPTTLARATDRLGFVKADPIRSPARAQDLTLRHRVAGYRAGDLERRYASLPVEEDFFVIYGFVASRLYALMHPRARGFDALSPVQARRARQM